MTKRTKHKPSTKTNTSIGKQQDAEPKKPQPAHKDGLRETIESVVVAFILAFLFRAFEAEAFVIPTGSMAPTLWGRNKEVDCEECGVRFTVGASDEVDREGRYFIETYRLKTAFCPNCRYENNIKYLPVFKGDRILVNKFPFELADPDRWDVAVFKYPEEPYKNYIKRIVGLPGEELMLRRGDVYARTAENGTFRILRKDDPDKQLALQLLMYDNAHPARTLHAAGFPQSWAPVKRVGENPAMWIEDLDGWQPDWENRTFEMGLPSTQADTQRWIRYRHYVPTKQHWDDARNNGQLSRTPQPQLISDFCAYNAYTGGHQSSSPDDIFWVGDLTLSCEVEIRKAQGEFLLELVEGVRKYRCRFDLETGEATLYYLESHLNPDEPEETLLATSSTDIDGPGTYRIIFANVDSRLCVWVDGDLVDIGAQGEYSSPDHPGPQDADLIPVGIAARQADVKVSHLMLSRDIYYRGDKPREQYNSESKEYPAGSEYLRGLLHDPEAWFEEYDRHHQEPIFAKLADDEYFMMGDNSPRSQDSRLWPNSRNAERRHAVPRSALVGKAFFIYWPHGVPFCNDGKGFPIEVWPLDRFFFHTTQGHHGQPDELSKYPQFTIPFYPNVFRMQRIR